MDVIFTPSVEELREGLEGALAHAMTVGAITELAEFESRFGQSIKTTATDFLDEFNISLDGFPEPFDVATELPPWMVQQVRVELTATFAEDYWQSINETTRNAIGEGLDEGIIEGWPITRMARRIQSMAGAYSRARATAVARTESSRSLYSGHVMAIEELTEETGLPIAKEWVSIMGTTIRETHAAAYGQTVVPSGNFNIGGFEAPYPANRSLPAQEVVNCNCVTISALI